MDGFRSYGRVGVTQRVSCVVSVLFAYVGPVSHPVRSRAKVGHTISYSKGVSHYPNFAVRCQVPPSQAFEWQAVRVFGSLMAPADRFGDILRTLCCPCDSVGNNQAISASQLDVSPSPLPPATIVKRAKQGYRVLVSPYQKHDVDVEMQISLASYAYFVFSRRGHSALLGRARSASSDTRRLRASEPVREAP